MEHACSCNFGLPVFMAMDLSVMDLSVMDLSVMDLSVMRFKVYFGVSSRSKLIEFGH